MELVIRATAIFWLLWLLVRGTGKRSLAELTPLDLILVVIVGDLAQQGVTQEDMSVTGAMVTVSVFMAWTFLADAMGRRWRWSARLLAGEPVILIHHGTPLVDRMTRERVDLDELKEAARLQGIADLGDVDYAVLETDGHLSFVRATGRGSRASD